MIEEPKPLTIKKNWERPSKKQLKAFENIPTGFVTDALNGEGTLSIDIKPVGDGRDINCVVVGAAVTSVLVLDGLTVGLGLLLLLLFIFFLKSISAIPSNSLNLLSFSVLSGSLLLSKSSRSCSSGFLESTVLTP